MIVLEGLMTLNIRKFMLTSKIIKVVLLLIFSTVIDGIGVQTFPQYVETGISFHSKVRPYFQDFHQRAVYTTRPTSC